MPMLLKRYQTRYNHAKTQKRGRKTVVDCLPEIGSESEPGHRTRRLHGDSSANNGPGEPPDAIYLLIRNQ